MVPAGQSVTLSASTQTSCLGIHGAVTLTGSLLVDNLLVYADGALTCDGGEIVIRDRPIDLATDPEQFGQAVIGFGKATLKGCTIRSENPAGVRGHVLFTQRADVDIRDSEFRDLGRTDASRPLNSATWLGDVATPGSNQIGRYALHLHHVMGPFPATKPYQFQIVGNRFLRNGKWGGVVAHRSSFGLIQGNDCRQATICYVEEDGSETANQWINNYAGQATGTKCENLTGYDPEGRCPAGFWLRGPNQTLRGNVIEDAERGIGLWMLCLETDVPPCGGKTLAFIPKFPGADVTDPAQILTCLGQFDGLPRPCLVGDQAMGPIEGNIFRRTSAGFDIWWMPRVQRTGSAILASQFADVDTPILLHYTNAVFDGLTATNCGTLVRQFNDATSAVGGALVDTVVTRATATCTDAIFRRIGQLQQPPRWRFSDSTFTSPNGVHLRYGGQTMGGILNQTVTIERSTFRGGPIVTTSREVEFVPDQVITINAADTNGLTFTRTLTVDGLDAPIPDGSVPPPLPPPVDCGVSAWSDWSAWALIAPTTEQRTRTRTVLTQPANGGLACPALVEIEQRAYVPPTVTVACTVTSVGSYADKDAKLTVRCNTNGVVLIPKGTAFPLTVAK